ncbi:hypothetical protein FEAC_22510 [Ferrimicrobium acidiphilum DSM 19497]|uniref:Uncharacterized protein n=1 Tax=Ferrimicrobium acidiphilum DSM 19497 TaxID=1121877 RepID=A0A0D8FS49_9ACTN|nr:hypothetical protein FEAC_22510 [Ferrimicrobium acidiphilum DSM 19497]
MQHSGVLSVSHLERGEQSRRCTRYSVQSNGRSSAQEHRSSGPQEGVRLVMQRRREVIEGGSESVDGDGGEQDSGGG